MISNVFITTSQSHPHITAATIKTSALHYHIVVSIVTESKTGGYNNITKNI